MSMKITRSTDADGIIQSVCTDELKEVVTHKMKYLLRVTCPQKFSFEDDEHISIYLESPRGLPRQLNLPPKLLKELINMLVEADKIMNSRG